MKTKLSLLLILSYFCIISVYIPADAKNNTQKLQRNIGNWITYIEKKGKKKICYTYSNPIKERMFTGERDVPYINLNYLGQNNFTITAKPGFDISQKHPILIIIDGDRKYNLNNKYKNFATTYNSDQDNHIINLLIKTTNNNFIIKSYMDEDNIALDYYSLSGFKESLQYLKNNCY